MLYVRKVPTMSAWLQDCIVYPMFISKYLFPHEMSGNEWQIID